MADGTLVFDTKLDSTGLSTGLSKVGGVAKGALGAVAAVGTAAVAAGAAIVNNSKEVAAYGDEVDKMSQKVGMSAKAYQEWDYVMQISGTEMSSMTTGLKTLTNKLDDARNGSDKAQAMFKQLGLSMSDMQNMSREEVFSAVITGFQGMADSTERAALANDLFGKSGQELAPLFNTSAEETQKLIEEVNKLGGVMSDDAVKASAAFQDQMTALSTSFDGLKRNMSAEFLPAITEVMGGLTDIFSGDYTSGMDKISKGIEDLVKKISDAIPKILETGAKIIETLAKSILDNIPTILPALVDLVMSIAKMIVENLPLLIETGLQIILELAKGIAEALPDLVPEIVDVVITIAETLIDNIDLLIDAAIELIMGLAEGLIKALPRLIEKIPEIIQKLIEGLIKNAPKLIEASIQLMIALGKGLVQAIPQIIKMIPQIITAIVGAFKNVWPQLKEAGLNLIKGLGEGIMNAKDWLVRKVKDLCSNALGAIKSFFGIASPSKKFKWIGEMCVEGMAEGLEDMDNLADGVTASLGNISANVSGGNVGTATNGGIAGAVAAVLEGMGVYMDGRAVGQVTAESVNDTLGRFAVRRA